MMVVRILRCYVESTYHKPSTPSYIQIEDVCNCAAFPRLEVVFEGHVEIREIVNHC